VIPSFNDGAQDLAEVIRLARRIGAEVIYDRYRPKPRADAHLAAGYRPVKPTAEWWSQVKKTVERICAEEGAACLDAEEEWRKARLRRAGR